MSSVLDSLPPQLRLTELPGERHMDILRTALRLIAERGLAGASLREVAKRVGMSQPSLYHYFKSKDELVEQIILFCGAEMLRRPSKGVASFPEHLADVPPALIELVVRVYDEPDYALFVRFMISVSAIKPKYRQAVRRVYEESLNAAVPIVMGPFISRGEITAEDALFLCRMAINAVALTMIEKRVIYGEKSNSDELERYTRFVSQMMRFLATERFGKPGGQ